MRGKVLVPPIKSQGIKTKLVPFINSLVPVTQQGRWIEPFMGTGVVGFNLANGPALMRDSNPHIIHFYNAIKNGKISSEITRSFLQLEGEKLRVSDGAYYYDVRERFNAEGNPLDFLFLTRSCFNGVMRFNRKGGFNVPFCKKPDRFSQAYVTRIVNQVDAVSKVIRSGDFDFRVAGFRETLDEAQQGDLIYCDPPYIARHTDYFNSWGNEDEFELEEMLRNTSASFILSTWSHNKYRRNHFIDTIWGKFPRVTHEHFYHVGGRESNRGGMTEALVFSPNLEPREIVAMPDSKVDTLF